MNKYKVKEVIRMLLDDGWVQQKGNGGDPASSSIR